MATKSIITRIKNKVDSLSAWQSYTGTLLNGEIAVVRVPTGTSYTNPVTGKTEPVVELLIKVGDGSTAFASLPWLSAKASDVYNWAKLETATDIPVTINGTASTLGAYLAKVDTNTANIASNDLDISNLTAKVDVEKVSTAISAAINALNVSTSSGSGNFVKAVTQSNGKISVTKGTIAESELPDISASKIKVDANTKLDTKLTNMDASIAANTAKLAGHTDAAINELITTKINALDGGTDSGSAGSGKYVSKVVQTDGKVATTYTSFPTASTTDAGIAKLGATGGAATYDSIFGSNGTGGINAQVNANKSDIANLKTAVAGGVHFIGTVTAKPTAASVTVNGSSTSTTASAGDVVIWAAEGIEYIYTGSAWEELGDVDRIGALETKINNLDVAATNAVSTTHKFVSQVTQTDGQVAVTYTQPTSADVSHDGSTVKVALENLAAGKSDTHDHPYLPNTTKYAGSSSVGGAATSANKVDHSITIKLNSGTTEGTNKFTFNGSAAKTIDITAGGVGAYTKAETDSLLAAKQNSGSYASSSHAHGNITNSGTITSTVVTSATGVLVYDSNNKIQRATADQTRAIIGAGTSNLTLGTTATTAAKGNHTHSTYEADITAIKGNYVRVNVSNQLVHSVNGTDTEIIFDCGGAS